MPLFIYITCASEDEAERIASALLDERLIACANILPGMRFSLSVERQARTGAGNRTYLQNHDRQAGRAYGKNTRTAQL